MNRNATDS
jgi:putative transposase